MNGKILSNGIKKISTPRLSREEKIKVLAAIQEFGLGLPDAPESPVRELDRVYHLANRWKAELEKCALGQKKVVFINFGQPK